MRMKNSVGIVLAAAITLSGCGTLSESECLTADWRLIGFEDGARGLPSSRIAEHRKACADYGIAPDFEAYRTGHAEGLRDYCTPANGFELGKRGGRYNGFCPQDLENEFLDAFHLGQDHFAFASVINQYAGSIASSHSRIKKLNEMVKEKEAAVISDKTTEKRRAKLLNEIKEHQQEIGELEAKVVELEKLKAVKEAEYSELPLPSFYR